MKSIILISFAFIITSCSKNCEVVPVNSNSHNLQELGLSSNNIYPRWPDTYQDLGDNQWFDRKIGDTLIVYRRDQVTDDSGDGIEYRFLIKTKQSIIPLNVKRISNDYYIEPQRLNQLMFDKPIVNFRLQQYTENEVLACEIETPNGDYFLRSPLVDRMWVILND
jgi:hypothetical protein